MEEKTMAIKINLDNTHAYCFPTKIAGGNGAEHILNIVLKEDADNGSIVTTSADSYVSFDQYTEESSISTAETIPAYCLFSSVNVGYSPKNDLRIAVERVPSARLSVSQYILPPAFMI